MFCMFKPKTAKQFDLLFVSLIAFSIIWMSILFVQVKRDATHEKTMIQTIQNSQLLIISNQNLIKTQISNHSHFIKSFQITNR